MKLSRLSLVAGVFLALGLIGFGLGPVVKPQVRSTAPHLYMAATPVAQPAKATLVSAESTAVAEAPAPAVEPRTFVIHFGFDDDAVGAEGQEKLAAVMRYAEQHEGARIGIAGHTDLAGARAYNERLAQRRAPAVAAQIVASGVTPEALEVSQHGEMQPAVATADGVQEARNRRVEITVWV